MDLSGKLSQSYIHRIVEGESIYLDDHSLDEFLGDWLDLASRNRARILLVEGAKVHVLDMKHLNLFLTAQEQKAVVSWRNSSGRRIWVLRNNELALQVKDLILRRKSYAALYRPQSPSPTRPPDDSFVIGI